MRTLLTAVITVVVLHAGIDVIFGLSVINELIEALTPWCGACG